MDPLRWNEPADRDQLRVADQAERPLPESNGPVLEESSVYGPEWARLPKLSGTLERWHQPPPRLACDELSRVEAAAPKNYLRQLRDVLFSSNGLPPGLTDAKIISP